MRSFIDLCERKSARADDYASLVINARELTRAQVKHVNMLTARPQWLPTLVCRAKAALVTRITLLV